MKHLKNYVVLFLVSFCLYQCKTTEVKENRTVIPSLVIDKEPSWDGNEQNSGLIDYVQGKGFLITKDAANRYTELTKRFGGSKTPPMTVGEGLVFEDDKIYLPNQYMVEFVKMNQKLKQGL